MNVRTIAAVWAGKSAGAASRLLGRGGGTAIAGVVAERVDPGVVRSLGRQAGGGAVCVTGTNGKTTTSLMLSRMASEAGLAPLHNRSGSNLMRGFAATLVMDASLSGDIPDASRRLAIFESDEAVLPHLVDAVPPRAIVFLNLFRDQLDRFGEVDAVAALWERMIGGLEAGDGRREAGRLEARGGTRDAGRLVARGGTRDPGRLEARGGTRDAGRLEARGGTQDAGRLEAPALVLNADDPAVAHLGKSTELPVVYFGVEDVSVAGGAAAGDAVEHASDFRTCLDCASELAYTAAFYGHIGHWRCPRCSNARPEAHVRAEKVTLGDDSTALEIALPDGRLRIALPLSGLYNAYNALAAVAAATALGLPRDAIVRALEGFSAAFGRQERFTVDGRDVHVLLGKNPAGLNQVLRTLTSRSGDKRLVFVLNDGIADGRDVSWIWDADYELLQPQASLVIASGTRAEDMALRLKYAGFGEDVPIERDRAAALRRAIAETPAGGTLHIIPTYTAMLEVRELLAKWSGAARFWESA